MANPFERKFDWDEARRMREDGGTYADIAAKLGVTQSAIYRICKPGAMERMQARTAEFQRSGTCSKCGGPASRNYHAEKGRPPICRACSARSKQTRFRRDKQDRIVKVRCPRCTKWKPPDAFQTMDPPRLYKTHCRSCSSKARQAYREAHREEDRAYARQRQRRRRAEA